jgi:hypothetical protein
LVAVNRTARRIARQRVIIPADHQAIVDALEKASFP